MPPPSNIHSEPHVHEDSTSSPLCANDAQELLRQRMQQASSFILQAVAEHGPGIPTLAHCMYEFTQAADQLPVPGDVACAPGCAYCCHTRVSASIPEVVVIAHQLRSNLPPSAFGDITALVRATCERGDASSLGWWLANAVPCPFLDAETGSLCSIYEIRPFTCRSHHSTDARTCRKGFEERTALDIPGYPLLRTGTDVYSSALIAALARHGLASHPVAFIPALDLALNDESAAARWIAGDDVFKAFRV